MFTEEELEERRQPQIEALVEIHAEHLNQEGNDELFGDDQWQKMRDAKIDQRVEADANV